MYRDLLTFCVIALCLARTKGTSTCTGPSSLSGGGCSYTSSTELRTRTAAETCCDSKFGTLAPVSPLMSGFLTHVNSTPNVLITSLKIVSSRVLNYGVDVTDDYRDLWENGKQPEGNFSCIAVKKSGSNDFALFVVNCSKKLHYSCIVVTAPCPADCTSDQVCGPSYLHYCTTACIARTTTAAAPPDNEATTSGTSTPLPATTFQSTTSPPPPPTTIQATTSPPLPATIIRSPTSSSAATVHSCSYLTVFFHVFFYMFYFFL